MKYGTGNAYSVALKAVLNDPYVDGVICIAIAPMMPEFSFLEVSEHLNSVMEEIPHKPVAAWLYGPSEKFESKKKIMIYPTLELAAWSLSLLRKKH
jgi:acyl-CoA synthetase (NDP forming)